MIGWKSIVLVVFGFALVTRAIILGQNPEQRQTQRTPFFENKYVKVWKTVIVPGAPLAMHRHEHGRSLVVLKGGTITIQQDTGEKRTMQWETGKAYWLDADPPGKKLHADVNEGKDDIEVVVMELKKDK